MTLPYAKLIGVRTYSFAEQDMLILVAGACYSLVYDFMMKLSGRTNLDQSIEDCVLHDSLRRDSRITVRVLGLSKLTEYCADLWQSSWQKNFCQQHWATRESIAALPHYFFANLAPGGKDTTPCVLNSSSAGKTSSTCRKAAFIKPIWTTPSLAGSWSERWITPRSSGRAGRRIIG